MQNLWLKRIELSNKTHVSYSLKIINKTTIVSVPTIKLKCQIFIATQILFLRAQRKHNIRPVLNALTILLSIFSRYKKKPSILYQNQIKLL